MEAVLPGLYASPPEPLPFAPSLHVRAFLLRRDQGEVAEVFSERMTLDDDFEVVPTPGHTSGATAYLWGSGELGSYSPATRSTSPRAGGSLRCSSRATTTRTSTASSRRELDFDVFVPWVATGRQPFHQMTDHPEARERIDRVLERLRRGQTH